MRNSDLQVYERPAVFLVNGIGDHLLALPAIRALTHLFDGHLTFIGLPGASRIFFHNIAFHTVCESHITIKDRTRYFDVNTITQTVGDCDLLISLSPWHSPSINQLLQTLRPADSIGFLPPFAKLVNQKRDESFFDTAFQVPLYVDPTLRIEDFAGPPVFAPKYHQTARNIRQNVPAHMRVLAVQASSSKPEKMWPTPKLAKLIDTFLDRHPDFIALDIGVEPLHLDQGRHSDRVIACHTLYLPAALSLIGEVDLFIGVDSCMLHAADLFRVPGVGLFGPTNEDEFGFRFGPHRHISSNGPMDNIEVAEVLDALESLLEELES